MPDSICNMAGQVALDYMYGSAVTGFDPRSARDAACLLLWGVNPSASAPHAHKHWFKEARGTKIVVDPVRHGDGRGRRSPSAAVPRQRRARLAFAMLHVIDREGLLDRDVPFQRHSIGWDEVEPDWPNARPPGASAQTGVPARLIEAAARSYGRGPSLLWLGQGLQRQPMGGNVFRAVRLAAGGDRQYRQARRRLLLPQRQRPQGHRRRKHHHARRSCAGRARAQREPDGPGRHARGSHAGRALFCWNINIAASNPDQARAAPGAASARICLRWWSTPSRPTRADFADIVLPAAGFLSSTIWCRAIST